MRNLREKLKKQGGFTLIEMLIVVAIIAILVAVSIPFIANAMDKTRHATDMANERAAKAEIMVQYMAGNEGLVGTTTGAITEDETYVYDANNGILVAKTGATVTPYSQCVKGGHTDMVIALQIDEDGQVQMQWVEYGDASTNATWNDNLCTGHSYQHD